MNLKGVSPLPSHFLSNLPSRLHSVRGREASFNSARLSFPSAITDEGVISSKDPLKSYVLSASQPSQTLEDGCVEIKEMKVHLGKGTHSNCRSDTMINKAREPIGGNMYSSSNSQQACKRMHYSLLMENLNVLEETFDDSDVLRVEREILLQLGRLGALNLFNICLSRTHKDLDRSRVPVNSGDMNSLPDSQKDMFIVSSRKKKQREKRRKRTVDNPVTDSTQLLAQNTLHGHLEMSKVSSAKQAVETKTRKAIVRNEADMSKGVKVVANLERIRTTLEEETGRAVSLSCWAEAAGMDKKMLQQHLQFGWYCRDELIRSTRSLVLYFTRNYRGLGIAHEDLIQAGSIGVLQGAERFDHTRGYKFSTYVQYWIRRSISKMVARHAKGIHVPCTLSRAIGQIQKARKALSKAHGKHPDEDEIVKLTGLSLSRIRAANKCLRVVGSIDQKVGDRFNAKYMEFVPDLSIGNLEKAVMRQHMKEEIHHLLTVLDNREWQVMVLRYGLKGSPPMSLQEIGRIFRVSKEWIRKIEQKAMTKLRDKETCINLRHYLDLYF